MREREASPPRRRFKSPAGPALKSGQLHGNAPLDWQEDRGGISTATAVNKPDNSSSSSSFSFTVFTEKMRLLKK